MTSTNRASKRFSSWLWHAHYNRSAAGSTWVTTASNSTTPGESKLHNLENEGNGPLYQNCSANGTTRLHGAHPVTVFGRSSKVK